MEKYIGTKTVLAEPMTRHEAYKNNLIRKSGDTAMQETDDEPGYKIEYKDGYQSWSPATAFEEAYRKADGLTFGQAIELLKKGRKVTRSGWNGRGMFLWLKPAATIKAEWCKDTQLQALVNANGGEILALGTVCMYTHDSTGRKAILTGWLASQSDILCEDWQEYEAE